jgi:uncharacterized protein (UPF0262 family)
MRPMAAATLEQILIDEHTWSSGSPERKHEWRLAINEVLEEGVFAAELPAPARAQVSLQPGRVRVEVVCDGAEVAVHELREKELKPLVDEYINTCREMTKLGTGSNSPRLEALDIAKRITHDEAGELIAGALPSLRPDHATGRRLFTLLITLLHDTTKLAAPPHRVRSGL